MLTNKVYYVGEEGGTMKNTLIDTARAEARKAAIEALKARGPVSNEKSVAALGKEVRYWKRY